jgi:glycosyltransferase involved in cell wall biosynthesis
MNDMDCTPILSVVVIGRNEGSNLGKVIQSISSLRDKLHARLQTIFVDSASCDDSSTQAALHFDEVYVLGESPGLCASAGRAVGTYFARGAWILYLDGDMELTREFADVIWPLIELDEDVSGYIGPYLSEGPEGSLRANRFRCRISGEMAPVVGGSLLLRRNEVLNAGNWDPSVFSNEEMELYSRLRNGKRSIKFMDIPLVIHGPLKLNGYHPLLSLLAPQFGLGKKWYGIGQILAARIQSRTLLSYVKMEPFPFVVWAGILLGMALSAFGQLKTGLLSLVVAFIIVWGLKGMKGLVLHCTQFVPALVGWSKYESGYTPQIVKVFRKGVCVAFDPGLSHLRVN